MGISTIIVTYNSDEELKSCIDSLKAGTMVPDEIIVVNNFPEQDCSFIEELHGEVILLQPSENKGFSHGINAAARQAKGDYLLISNPDVVFSRDAVEKMIKGISSASDIGVSGPKVLNENGEIQFSARNFPTPSTFFFHRNSFLTRLLPGNRFSQQYLNPAKESGRCASTDWVSGCCFITKADLFRELNGFDDRYFLFMEDVDYCWRVSKANYRVVYDQNPVVTHSIGISNAKTSNVIIRHRHQSIRRFIDIYFADKSLLFRSFSKLAIWLREKVFIFKNLF